MTQHEDIGQALRRRAEHARRILERLVLSQKDAETIGAFARDCDRRAQVSSRIDS